MAADPRAMGKVAVLLGGRSAEREVSLRSGAGVLAALRGAGVDAHPFDPAQRPLDDLRREGFERAFIALHGRYGEDGTVQGALELLGIPYTGSGVQASAIAMDKVRTKEIWRARGLPTPASVVLARGDTLREVPDTLGLPLIVKPPHEGSTLGVTKVLGYSQMAEAFETAARYDELVLAEAFIEGPELTVAILGSGAAARALPVIEIRAPGGNYDFRNKYFGDDTEYLCPAPLPEALAARVRGIALSAFLAIGCEGWGRVDLMLRRRDSEPFLLELNTSPGMTDHSLVPMAARAVGLGYPELVLELLAGASLKIGRRA
jgi:D-alanine-D-alanine ligase